MFAAILGTLLAFLYFAWRVRVVVRTIFRVHHAEGLGDKLDAFTRHIPHDVLQDSMFGAGSERPAQQSLTRMRFGTTPGVIVVTVMVLIVLFYISFVRPELARADEIFPMLHPETIVLIKLGIMALGAYTLVFHLANSISIDGSELVTMSPLFQRRYYDLNKLKSIRLGHNGNYLLRFSDGKTARILKYVTGHDEMVQALENAIAANQERTCRNFPKSKRSAGV